MSKLTKCTIAFGLLILAATFLWSQSRVNSLQVGGGSTLQRIIQTSVTFDPASVPAVSTSTQTVSSAVTGAVIGDAVTVNPRGLVAAGLAQGECFVSAADTVCCTFVNPTAGAVDAASQTWDILVIRAR